MEQRSYNTMAMGRSSDHLTDAENPFGRSHSSNVFSDSFWGRRTKIEQLLIVISTILAILSFSLIIAVIVLANKKVAPDEPSTTEVPNSPTTPAVSDKECTTEICKAAADKLKASINDSVDPCEDFYSYVCSRWIGDNPIPADMPSYSKYSIVDQNVKKDLQTALGNSIFEADDVRTKAKIFFQTCINNDTRESKGVDGIKKVLEKLGGWPILGLELKDYSWIDALVQTTTELSPNIIITVGVGVDNKNTTRNIISMDQTSLGFGLNELVDNNGGDDDGRSAKIMSAYKTFIKTSAKLLGSSKNDTELDAEVEDIVKFEMNLTRLISPPERRRDPNSLYNKYTVNSFQELIEELDIKSFLSKVMKNITEVTDDTEIIVAEPVYLVNVTKLLNSGVISNVTIANYIGWRVVEGIGPQTTQAFRDAQLEYAKVLSGIEEGKPLEEICIEATNEVFGFALGSIYINNNFDIETKAEIEYMVNQLRIAFAELLKTNPWMNDESKKRAENKLNEMIPMIAYPPWINDTNELNKYYEEIGEIKQDDHFENIISLMKFFIERQLKKINELHNRTTEWVSPPAVINAFYNPSANTITFPAGILNFPFYQVGLPPAVNFAGIGSVIGHEITHGFDDQGRHFDSEGNLRDWWPEEVEKKFEEEAQCFVEQYGNYTDPETGMGLNGRNTLGENIADNGGIREAFKAYRTFADEAGHNIRLPGLDFTPDQLFFVSFANIWCSNERKEFLKVQIKGNTHSPSRFRVQGSCSNFEEFSNAFNCPKNSTMNPQDRCFLW